MKKARNEQSHKLMGLRSVLAVLTLMLVIVLCAACSAPDPSESEVAAPASTEAYEETKPASMEAEEETIPTSAVIQSEWSDWSAWSDQEVTASDTRQVETASMYRYYAFICPHCGARIPYKLTTDNDYGICYEELDGCGETSGSVDFVLVYLSNPPSEATQWKYNKRYIVLNEVRWFINNGDEAVTVYRYRDEIQ